MLGADRDTELLVRAGIDAMSVNFDGIDGTRRLVTAAERRVCSKRRGSTGTEARPVGCR
jgi:hypothetical protein